MSTEWADYFLVGYEVHCDEPEIRLYAEQVSLDNGASKEVRFTRICFTGVEAYQFDRDNCGGILLEIVEQPLATFIEEQEGRFDETFRSSGWPRFWQGSKKEALEYLEAYSVKTFRFTTSYGMTGWILARAVETVHTIS